MQALFGVLFPTRADLSFFHCPQTIQRRSDHLIHIIVFVISKPSAETLRNRQIVAELAQEINARSAEFTAADIAEFYTDPDGMPLTARKVGALLRQAVAMGLIAVSPEPWSVKHYAPVGFEFAKKPIRVKKSKDADADADNAE